jgi:2-dehydro-3-deoxy-D-gluconate 5-dehydrogenase
MILDLFKLEGKVALVTGGCTGLGEGMAVGLAEAGADILTTFHSTPPDGLESRVTGLGRRFGAIRADLARPETMEDLAAEACEALGKVDILVNNAGIIRRAELLAFDQADWDEVMNVNLKSLFLLSQSVARRMVDTGLGGKIINIASMLSYQGGIRVPSYTASKHGVMGLTKIMANELAAKGINVNAIAPGYMATENTRALREDPKRNAQILARIPTGRWGAPEDLQGAVVFLASRASDYLQGETIAVDGGWLSR